VSFFSVISSEISLPLLWLSPFAEEKFRMKLEGLALSLNK